MDSINRVGNTMATSNDEIVEMLKRSSAAMYAANNTLAETIALEAASVQITRNAQITGTAFRTISMRIRGFDEETEEYIGGVEELTGKIADLTKTADHPGGITLFTDANKTEYKSTYQILKDISEIWHELTDKQQASLLEALGGKRGGQALAGILDDFSSVDKALKEIENSAGSAEAEMDIVRESIEFKWNALKETWVDFAKQLLSRQDIGELFDSLIEASEQFGTVIESLIPVVKELLDLIGLLAKGIGNFANTTGGAFPVILGALGVGAFRNSKGLKGGGLFSNLIVNGALRKIWNEISGKEGGASKSDVTSNIIQFPKVNKALDETTKKMTETAKGANTATLATEGLGAALKGLLTPAGKIVLILGAVATAFAVVWDATTTTVKEAQEELEKTTNRVSDLKKEIEDLENIDYRNASQQERLEMLKQELSVQEDLLEVEQKRIALEKYGSRFEDSFDPDNMYRQYQNERASRLDSENGSDVSINVDALNAAYEKMATLEQEIASGMYEENELKKKSNELDLAKIRYTEKLEVVSKELLDYQTKRDEIQAELDAGYIEEGTQAYENALEMIETYDKWIGENKEAINSILKETGQFDYTSAIGSAFDHVEFEGLKDELVELGKTGELSVDLVAEKIKELMPLLLAAGMDAESIADEVYAYIMNLADPYKADKEQLAKRISEATQPIELTNRGRKISKEQRAQQKEQLKRQREEDKKEIQDYLDTLSEEEFEIVSNLDVDWSTFDAKDVIEKMQAAIDEAGKVEVKVVAETEFDVDRLEHLTASLKTVNDMYSTLVENKGEGKTGKDLSYQIADVEKLREGFVDTAGNVVELTEEQEKLFKSYEAILTEGTASADEIADALDGISTMYADALLEAGDYSEETQQLVKNQMELNGITKESAEEYVKYKVALNQLNEGESKYAQQLDDIIEKNWELKNSLDEAIKSRKQWNKDFKTDRFAVEGGKVGNVDIFKRPIINNGDGSYSTTYTGTYAYDSKNGGDKKILIHATPILPNGKQLTDVELEKYLDELVSKATSDADILNQDKVENGGMGILYEVDTKTTIDGVEQDITAENLKRALELDNFDEVMHELQATIYSDEGLLSLDIEASNAKEQLEELAEQIGVTVSDLGAYVLEKEKANDLSLYDGSDIEYLVEIGNDCDVAADKMLEFLQQAAQARNIVIDGDYQWLIELCAQLDIAIDKMNALLGMNKSGVYGISNGKVAYVPTDVTRDIQNQRNKSKLENEKKDTLHNTATPKSTGGGGAADAGKADGDAYVQAYEKELEQLGKLKDQGLITEKQYLDRMRALYEKYFRGLSKYQDKYNEEQQKYLQGMLSLYNQAISAVGSIIDRRIKGLNKERDAIIKGYEDQKKAIQKVIDAKQKQIEGIQAEIDVIQEEIDAINKANEARQRQLNLQQDLYNLERLMSQRTRLVYKNGQMVYQNDTRELRDAREKVYQDQIQEEIAAKEEQIAQKEKEIKLIEKEIEALEKQQEAIDKMIEETNEYFDKLIEALEDYKDRWQELAELEEQAKLMAVLEELGYSTDDILNMSEEAFQSFKGEYLGILKDMNSGNEYFLDSLGKLAEVDMGNIPGYLEQTVDAINSMDTGNLDNLEQGLKDVDSALGGSGATAGSGGGAVGGGTVTGGGSGIAGKANDASQALQDMSDVDLTALDTALQSIYDICEKLDTIFGKDNNFVSLIKSLGNTEGVSLQGLIDQFNVLQEAITAVSTALGGGGGEGENLTDKGFPDSKGESKTESEGGEGLLQAIEAVNNADLSNIIGQFGGKTEEGEESEGGNLLSAVNAVTKAIGTEDSEIGKALVPTIMDMPNVVEEPIQEVITWFTELQEVIASCVTAITQLGEKMANLKMPTLFGGKWTGTAYASGTAYSSGNWSAGSKGHKGGKALVGELGPEIIVSSDGKYRTVGDHGAEFVNLKKSDIVFNHAQSAALLSKGKTKGRAYASGTLPEGFSPLSSVESSKFGLFDKVKDIGQKLEISNVALKSIDRTVQQINSNKTTVNNSPTINVSNVQFTCTGVTGEDVLHQIESQFTGIISRAYQQSMAQ